MTGSTPHRRGRSYPLGAAVHPDGVNFSVYSRHATAIELLLFDGVEAPAPARVIALDARAHRTYHYWHVFVPGVTAGQIYAYRARGPFEPQAGDRFDPDKVLLDPYGTCLARPRGYSRAAACGPGDNAAVALKSVVAPTGAYDWEDDAPPRRPFSRTVIYEMHVGGFTRHPSSGVAAERRGTYAGLVEKIPYLRDLGVTAVELMPVAAFDEQDGPPGLANYWGYSPVSFFAPHPGYSSRRDPLGVLDEFRDMVKALHRAGLEVILDVVYNHTAEGSDRGPTLCWRGLANATYYILESNRAYYANYTGCGNTLNANESIVRRLILDSLHYWVREMHVDGFRFDLASILSRDEQGRPMQSPPVVWDIESDPVLANVKLIAEAWDPAGLYQVGSFVGDSWKEWNGRFRDDVRAFVKSDSGRVRAVAYRLMGSPDVYGGEQREAEQSVNFVTCHDGFTLNDLVSYNGKHNEANGEGSRDGATDNLSWNCGSEGPTDDAAIEALRRRQVKNLLALTLLSAGTPMLLMGDEVRRTQRGNNNAYCQNNDISWFDWALVERHADLRRFVRQLIRFRLSRGQAAEPSELTLIELLRLEQIQWHGVRLGSPDWSDSSRTVAFTALVPGRRLRLHAMLNAFWEPLEFEIPPPGGNPPWRRCIDTFRAAPEDIHDLAEAPAVTGASYRVEPRSVVVLLGRIAAPAGPGTPAKGGDTPAAGTDAPAAGTDSPAEGGGG